MEKNSNKPIVLLVEDEIKFIEKFKDRFRRNYKVLHAKDEKDAISICEKDNQIELVILDLNLTNDSKREGLELIPKLKKHLAPHIPYFMLSMSGNLDMGALLNLLSEAQNKEVVEFLFKKNFGDNVDNFRLKFNQAIEFGRELKRLRAIEHKTLQIWRNLLVLYRQLNLLSEARNASEEVERLEAAEEKLKNRLQKIQINKIELIDFVFFEKITWKPEPQINILLGRNGYGKTFLYRILLSFLSSNDEFIEYFLSQCKNEEAEIKIELRRGEEDLYVKRAKNPNKPARVIEKIPVLAITDIRSVNKSITTIPKVLSPIDIVEDGFINFIFQKPMERIIYQLFNILFYHYKKDKSFESSIFKIIIKAIEYFTDTKLKFDRIEEYGAEGLNVYVITETHDVPIPIQQVSQGTLSIISILGLLYEFLDKKGGTNTNPLLNHGIVFIDEIDAHLHPAWQRKIVPFLRDNFPNVQFFLSAHSPLIVAGTFKNEVNIIKKSEEGLGFILKPNASDLLGIEVSDLYHHIFEIEELDVLFLRILEERGNLDDIRKKLDKLENKADLSMTEQEKLDGLYSKEDRIVAAIKRQKSIDNKTLLRYGL